jgi:hypothetical protein
MRSNARSGGPDATPGSACDPIARAFVDSATYLRTPKAIAPWINDQNGKRACVAIAPIVGKPEAKLSASLVSANHGIQEAGEGAVPPVNRRVGHGTAAGGPHGIDLWLACLLGHGGRRCWRHCRHRGRGRTFRDRRDGHCRSNTGKRRLCGWDRFVNRRPSPARWFRRGSGHGRCDFGSCHHFVLDGMGNDIGTRHPPRPRPLAPRWQLFIAIGRRGSRRSQRSRLGQL